MRWIKASERLPDLTPHHEYSDESEPGILFRNKIHSSAFIYYPSLRFDDPLASSISQGEGWERENWEWLDESQSISKEEEDLGTKLIKAMGQVNDLELEVERLKYIIEKLVKDDNMFNVHVQESYKEQRWQQFKKENNL